jgi:hypothetical protein
VISITNQGKSEWNAFPGEVSISVRDFTDLVWEKAHPRRQKFLAVKILIVGKWIRS